MYSLKQEKIISIGERRGGPFSNVFEIKNQE